MESVSTHMGGRCERRAAALLPHCPLPFPSPTEPSAFPSQREMEDTPSTNLSNSRAPIYYRRARSCPTTAHSRTLRRAAMMGATPDAASHPPFRNEMCRYDGSNTLRYHLRARVNAQQQGQHPSAPQRLSMSAKSTVPDLSLRVNAQQQGQLPIRAPQRLSMSAKSTVPDLSLPTTPLSLYRTTTARE